ncbi:50S ribosomal protein L21 [Candidatus Pantoea carbekii]|uniref:Large ribosomal subunit protein bL21 n=1 Tax=Candidatus Pantoea carbekii TaxID=1235990 RepID=U3U7R5_9GAMM|nr:50S ribosomal protein L21 [Candidatus Pantoea carbekii]AKC32594.1 50S ribosomal protein L21 [Candidatus Pantoea carbekii]BAO00334.1 RplU protein [Candidatus Pantoea carbekii]
MYAVFKSGGKQHRVTQGQIIRLEKIDIATGKIVEFCPLLMIVNGQNTIIGTPSILGSMIKAEVICHGRNDKIKIVKFRRRKHYRKQAGHRQWFTDVKIIDITTCYNEDSE